MKPKPLKPGETIGIFSCSSPTTNDALGRLRQYFEAKGYSTKVAPHTLLSSGYMAGDPEQRASDLNLLFADDTVPLIMTATGGASAIQMLSFVDYMAIAKKPKILVGLSDPTCLLNAITAQAGIPTFHGPNGYNFGHKSPTTFTETNWWNIVTGKISIPYLYPIADSARVVRTGPQAEGTLVGGNLRNILYLVGTPYFTKEPEILLFFEEIGVPLHEIDAHLTHLKLAGVFDKVKGLVIGQLVGCEDAYKMSDTIESLALRALKDYDFPILSNVPLGHTGDKVTVPIGCRARVLTSPAALELCESPFS